MEAMEISRYFLKILTKTGFNFKVFLDKKFKKWKGFMEAEGL
jgi:hypothetical protein